MKIEWEKIEGGAPVGTMYRVSIPGGWLVATQKEQGSGMGTCTTFVPDPEHKWGTDASSP